MEGAKGREIMSDDLYNSRTNKSNGHSTKKRTEGHSSPKKKRPTSSEAIMKKKKSGVTSSVNTKGKSSSRKKKKKKKALRIIISLLFILALVAAIFTTIFIKTVNSMNIVDLNKDNLGITDHEELKDYDQYDKIKNIMLFGVDAENVGGAGRSDSMMLITIDPVHDKLKVTSLMRDARVLIDGYGEDKLNHAYAFGGPELAIKTINENFGLNIKDFATVDFATLPKVIDAVGGVEIEITSDELDDINEIITIYNGRLNTNTPTISSPGLQTLSGDQVLAYTRNRSSAGGDFMRTQRQRIVLEALFKKGLSTSPTKYPGILNNVLPLVTTSMTSSDILSLSKTVFSLGNGNLEQARFPLDDYSWGDYADDDIWYLFFDREVTKQQMKDYIFDDKSITE